MHTVQNSRHPQNAARRARDRTNSFRQDLSEQGGSEQGGRCHGKSSYYDNLHTRRFGVCFVRMFPRGRLLGSITTHVLGNRSYRVLHRLLHPPSTRPPSRRPEMLQNSNRLLQNTDGLGVCRRGIYIHALMANRGCTRAWALGTAVVLLSSSTHASSGEREALQIEQGGSSSPPRSPLSSISRTCDGCMLRTCDWCTLRLHVLQPNVRPSAGVLQ